MKLTPEQRIQELEALVQQQGNMLNELRDALREQNIDTGPNGAERSSR